VAGSDQAAQRGLSLLRRPSPFLGVAAGGRPRTGDVLAPGEARPARRCSANNIGVEDALTWISLADQEAGQDAFRQFYTADSWEGFLAEVRMWQQAKQR